MKIAILNLLQQSVPFTYGTETGDKFLFMTPGRRIVMDDSRLTQSITDLVDRHHFSSDDSTDDDFTPGFEAL